MTHPYVRTAVDEPFDVLVFSKTTGYRHDSIPAGVQAIRLLGAANGFSVAATEDSGRFTPGELAGYEVVVFLNTTGDVLDAAQKDAFEAYVRSGGGFVGVHAAADTEYDWPFFGELVGAHFASHPAVQRATVRVESRAHAATAHLGPTWVLTDEWYDYRTNPRGTARILSTVDESTYSGGAMGEDHPHTWCKTVGDGRSFYTGSGHTAEIFADPNFRKLLLGGIRYAAGRTNADSRPETGYTTLHPTTAAGGGVLWRSAAEFRTYSLKLDWRMARDTGSGAVVVGFPGSALSDGREVWVGATATGAVNGRRPADPAARDAALNPPGEWNTYELLVEGGRLRVFLNGVQVNDFTGADQPASGHIAVVGHGSGGGVSFRDIRIKELDTAAHPSP
ncbi:MAG: DUF1080 domain-containing protein [Saccharothrix sp.]|nr:DUF1080 domain-containing protein [Saccharothrix sp.]